MKTIVLDDDPTGTQSASGVTVLLAPDEESLLAALSVADSVYVLTNSRAIGEPEAVALVSEVRRIGLSVAERLGEEVQFVLRGDSTLRGHVFAESEVFLDDASVLIFVPAFPEGGRTTIGGTHYVAVRGMPIEAHLTEYADDPVFPFGTSTLVDYVAQKSGRIGVSVGLDRVRSGGLAAALGSAAPGTVVLPDAETGDDIRLIADAIRAARVEGTTIVVRSASPLAAALAGVESDGLLASPLVDGARRTLLVCGSHTDGATAQLEQVAELFGPATVIPTSSALSDPVLAGDGVGALAAEALRDRGFAVVTTERVRSAEHNTLAHGEKVMAALTGAVAAALPAAEVVVSKGGITSADVARIGLGATTATVLGQVLPGISVWSVPVRDGRELLYVVVPGNVGGPDALTSVLTALEVRPQAVPAAR